MFVGNCAYVVLFLKSSCMMTFKVSDKFCSPMKQLVSISNCPFKDTLKLLKVTSGSIIGVFHVIE